MIPAVLMLIAEALFAFWMAWILWQMRAHGAPFWPSSQKQMDSMLQLAQITMNDHVVDLGSGDGRLVLKAAESGAAEAVGYEIDPFWYNVSQRKQKKYHHAEKIKFIKKSFWEEDLSRFTVVFLYQGKHILKPLAEKLKKELPLGARVISNSHALPDWKISASLDKSLLFTVEKESHP